MAVTCGAWRTLLGPYSFKVEPEEVLKTQVGIRLFSDYGETLVAQRSFSAEEIDLP